MKIEAIRNQAGAATANKPMKKLILNLCAICVLGVQIQANL
jgi:hypothetical protein